MEKVLENRLRRQVDRMGYRLVKSRARDSRDITYGGFQIVDLRTGGVVAGHTAIGRGYGLTLDDVKEWVEEEHR